MSLPVNTNPYGKKVIPTKKNQEPVNTIFK